MYAIKHVILHTGFALVINLDIGPFFFLANMTALVFVACFFISRCLFNTNPELIKKKKCLMSHTLRSVWTSHHRFESSFLQSMNLKTLSFQLLIDMPVHIEVNKIYLHPPSHISNVFLLLNFTITG